MRRTITGFAIVVAAFFGLNLICPTDASASTLEWEFTYIQNSDPSDNTVTGAFSIPVADFAGNPSFVPNKYITDMSLTLNGHEFSLSDVLLSWGGNITNIDGMNFLYNSNVPTPYYFTFGWLVSAGGCDPSVSTCTLAIQIGNQGLLDIDVPEFTQVGGAWQSAEIVSGTPLPATWTLMLIGLAGLGFIGYRQSKKRAVPIVA
jgi:hypothetical protein